MTEGDPGNGRDDERDGEQPDALDGPTPTGWQIDDPDVEVSRAERRRRERQVIEEGRPREGVDVFRPVEKAVLVGVQLPGRNDRQVEASLNELHALSHTAGAKVVDRVVQRRDAPDAATYIGKGKVRELKRVVAALGADAVIFDDDLSPAQQRNLEEGVGQKVLDRTIVILDIFAQHATSREAKTQIELAQLNYMLPRLRGWGEALSRQAGGRAAGGMGIGGRGPGETQLEVDRRKIMRRIRKLKDDLDSYAATRRTKSRERERRRVPIVALVGYTNAGKSSLLNRMTGADADVRNQLFATLDTTARSLDLPDGRNVVVTDTVGFVRKLPHGLIEAFKSTLEESARSDLLLHVVDVAHPEAQPQIEAVREVLAEIGADDVPEQLVLNKADIADPKDVGALVRAVQRRGAPEPVVVSARADLGIDDLLETIALRLPDNRYHVSVTIPYERTELVNLAHLRGEVHKQEHSPEGTELVATVDEEVARAMRDLLDPDPFGSEPEPWES